ncbi:MAG TPA: hypothetical protein VKE22_01895 [Haliangiales bacterium]|nr:hypothetical protein [Haliangiales bacterium]
MKKILSLVFALFVGTMAFGCGSSQKPEPAKPGDQPAAAPTDPSQTTPPPATPTQPK